MQKKMCRNYTYAKQSACKEISACAKENLCICEEIVLSSREVHISREKIACAQDVTHEKDAHIYICMQKILHMPE